MKLKRLGLTLVVCLLFITDRLLKQFVMLNAAAPSADFFYFTKIINQAGPFSLPIPLWVLLIFSVLALLWLTHLAVAAYKQKNSLRLFGVMLMLAGGLSNIWDRVVWGGVVDIWQLSLGSDLSFNLSDVYLLIGFVFILLAAKRTDKLQAV